MVDLFNSTTGFVNFDSTIMITVFILLILLFLQIYLYCKNRIAVVMFIVELFTIIMGFESMSLAIPLNPYLQAFIMIVNTYLCFKANLEANKIKKENKKLGY